jgi:hypothetical protein
VPSVNWDWFFIILFTRGTHYWHKYMGLSTVSILNAKDLSESSFALGKWQQQFAIVFRKC